MNGSKLKITFYLISGTKVSTFVDINDLCDKNEDGSYTTTTDDDTSINFKSIESFAVIIRSGISSTLNQWYSNDKPDDMEPIMEFGDIVVPIEMISAARVSPVIENEIPEENYVTVEELEE